MWKTLQDLYPLTTYACLQFAPDNSINSEWFKELHISVYGGINSMDLQKIPLPDACMDVVVCNHVLEHVADDAAALREMLRITRRNGFAQLSVPTPRFEKTEDWGYPDEQNFRHYREYGKDIVKLFARALPQAYLLTMLGRDACTGAKGTFFLISHAPITRPVAHAFPRAHFQRLDEETVFPSL